MGTRFGHVLFPLGCGGAIPLVIETCLPLKAMRLLADLFPWIPGLVSNRPGCQSPFLTNYYPIQ